MKEYLKSDEIINWKNLSVLDLARKLSLKTDTEDEIAKKCFEWVRDNIKHSYDYKLNPVTCIASEVLKYKTGYCFAKSHLLAALLRANNIPAGFCYQRLIKDKSSKSYCLHGLSGVYLKKYGWYRVDPRGNKKGINAQFDPPKERLAFQARTELEADLPKIWQDPLKEIIDVLTKSRSYIEVYDNLPDVE